MDAFGGFLLSLFWMRFLFSLHSHIVNLSASIKEPPAAGILSSNLLPSPRALTGKV